MTTKRFLISLCIAAVLASSVGAAEHPNALEARVAALDQRCAEGPGLSQKRMRFNHGELAARYQGGQVCEVFAMRTEGDFVRDERYVLDGRKLVAIEVREYIDRDDAGPGKQDIVHPTPIWNDRGQRFLDAVEGKQSKEEAESMLKYTDWPEQGEWSLPCHTGMASLRLESRSGVSDALHFQIVGASSPVSIQEQADLLGKLLEQSFRERSKAPAYRFHMDFYSEMRPRLITAAANSPLWDAKTGRPHSGLVNDRVMQLINEPPIYTELLEVFAAQGYSIRLASLEKADKFVLPYRNMQGRGIAVTLTGAGPTDRFPMGALINFYEVQRKVDASPPIRLNRQAK